MYDVPKSDNKVDKPEKIDKSVIRKEVTEQPTQVSYTCASLQLFCPEAHKHYSLSPSPYRLSFGAF